MPRNQQYSISKKLALMNVLVSAVALLLATFRRKIQPSEPLFSHFQL